MIADFNRYLKNTTIFEYKTNNKKWPIFHRNNEYKSIKIDWINYFSNQSFFQFIDKIYKENIKPEDDFIINIEKEFGIKYENDFSKKIRSLFLYIIEKYSKRKEEYALRSIFRNLKDFFEKSVFGEENKDNNWNEILISNYTYTDAENFYNAIWNDTIRKIFKWNKNIEKIRETRNKFIEHKEDSKIIKKWDFRRDINFIWWWNNTTWEVYIKIHITNENKTYEFSLCPLLDFCVFIEETLKLDRKNIE